jgi:hypothetical protein
MLNHVESWLHARGRFHVLMTRISQSACISCYYLFDTRGLSSVDLLRGVPITKIVVYRSQYSQADIHERCMHTILLAFEHVR